jgi:hypothetical protein
MSGIPLPMCKRCGTKPATQDGCCDTCLPEEKSAKAMEGVLGNSPEQNYADSFPASHSK